MATRSFAPTQAQDAAIIQAWKKFRTANDKTEALVDAPYTQMRKAADRSMDLGFNVMQKPADTVQGIFLKLLVGLEHSNTQTEYEENPTHPGEAAIMSAIEDLRRMVGPEFATWAGVPDPMYDKDYRPAPRPKTPNRPDWDKPIMDLWWERRDVLEAAAAFDTEIKRLMATGRLVGDDITRVGNLYRLMQEAVDIAHAIEAKMASVEVEGNYGLAHQAVLLAHSFHAGPRSDKADETVARRLLRMFDPEGIAVHGPKEWLPLIEAEEAERIRMEAERDLFVGLKKPLDRQPLSVTLPDIDKAEARIAKAREQFPIPPKPHAEPEPEPADEMLMALWDGRGHTQDQRRAYYAAYEKADTEEEYTALGEDVHIDRLGAAEARIAKIEPQTHAGWMAQAAIVATAYFDEVSVNPLAAFHMAERIVRKFDPKGIWQIEDQIERRREMEERNARKEKQQ